MMKMILTAIMAIAVPIPAYAAQQTVTENHIYAMGDNDSRSDARALCAAAAKRDALDKVGSILESSMSVRQTEADGHVAETSERTTRSYLAAVVRSDVTDARMTTQGDRSSTACTVRVTFDPDDVRQKLAAIAGDGDLRGKLMAQQQRMDEMEARMRSLSQTSAENGPDIGPAAIESRQQRINAVAVIGDADAIRRAAMTRVQGAAQRAISVKTGMTFAEMCAIAGMPGEGAPMKATSRVPQVYDYGGTWITVVHGVVACKSVRRNPICNSIYAELL